MLHEYAHILQNHISRANSWASVHDGCAMRLTSGGALINSPEYAWTEAFAEYFAQAVRRTFANEPSLNGFAATASSFIDSPPACGVVGATSQAGTITPAMIENFIAASLWDLIDPVGNPAQGFEGHDTVAGEDATVFQIFDRKIDNGPANIFTFRTAWNARGKSFTGLECILSFYGIVPAMTGCRPGALKLVGDFNNDRKTDIALTAVSGWGSIPVAFSNGDGSFNVTNQASATFASLASSRGVVKLTGDFDGDGDTDIALTGGPGFTGIPVALSDGNGSFTFFDNPTAMLHTIAANPENRKLVGDFDGNGTADTRWWARRGSTRSPSRLASRTCPAISPRPSTTSGARSGSRPRSPARRSSQEISPATACATSSCCSPARPQSHAPPRTETAPSR